jgi:RNA:NAD 2'-phosphotransferase (TPT1/KptA family)
MAILHHASFRAKLSSILRRGLLTAKSTGKRPAVWLCSAANAPWAALHVAARHGGSIRSVVILEIDVPRAWLRRHGKGLFYVPRDIPPERIRGISTFGRLAAAPAA